MKKINHLEIITSVFIPLMSQPLQDIMNACVQMLEHHDIISVSRRIQKG